MDSFLRFGLCLNVAKLVGLYPWVWRSGRLGNIINIVRLPLLGLLVGTLVILVFQGFHDGWSGRKPLRVLQAIFRPLAVASGLLLCLLRSAVYATTYEAPIRKLMAGEARPEAFIWCELAFDLERILEAWTAELIMLLLLEATLLAWLSAMQGERKQQSQQAR